jgi:hypothetical protein
VLSVSHPIELESPLNESPRDRVPYILHLVIHLREGIWVSATFRPLSDSSIVDLCFSGVVRGSTHVRPWKTLMQYRCGAAAFTLILRVWFDQQSAIAPTVVQTTRFRTTCVSIDFLVVRARLSTPLSACVYAMGAIPGHRHGSGSGENLPNAV